MAEHPVAGLQPARLPPELREGAPISLVCQRACFRSVRAPLPIRPRPRCAQEPRPLLTPSPPSSAPFPPCSFGRLCPSAGDRSPQSRPRFILSDEDSKEPATVIWADHL